MEKTKSTPVVNELNRREFIQNAASFSALMTLMGGMPLYAEDSKSETTTTQYNTMSAPMNCAVIGCGAWGREILQTLSRLPNAPVVAICDNYEAIFHRAKEAAPNAETFTDFKKLLERKEVQAVIVATPSHLHREIVEAALASGKHVYCEAPFAHTVEDTKAIAKAAKAAVKVNFQSGLQMRSDPQRHFLLPFIRSGAAGKNVVARSQWHKKQSWRRAAANPEREKAVNWQIGAATSPGLMGEVVIHQLDMIRWLLNARPLAVSGWGSILNWKDGRDVADTVQALFEFPNGVNFCADAALTTSFDSSYEILNGTDSTLMMRTSAEEGARAWLFKEVDAPLLGWEVYARKEQFYHETGIALVADASKQQKAQKAGEPPAPVATSLQHALAAFIANSGVVAKGVEDFTASFGDDANALREYITGPTIGKALRPAAKWRDGLEATLLALKANEAICKGQGNRVVIEPQLFEI